jgi:DNA-binding NtrC family response regulator
MATLPLPPISSPAPLGGVLVASADGALREHIASSLNHHRWPVLTANGGADALGKLESSECDVLLLDGYLPDLDCEELMRMVEQQYPGVEILRIDPKTRSLIGTPKRWTHGLSDVFGAHESNDHAGFVAAPVLPVEALPGMVGADDCMKKIYRAVRLVARRSTTVLITGPTGSGKELVARAVHELSPRAEKPFVVINCAAIPEALLETELFGYARGAFTGAVQPRAGRIQSAQGGTLFLDEIGELPVGLQAKLLRFLERGEVQRLGSTEVFRVDVRVVAATNAELAQRVEQHEFREDLYYRLSVFPIELPALHEHKGDIPFLIRHFVEELSPGRAVEIGCEAEKMLLSHDWPGNVRELRHVLERALILSEDAPMIEAEHIQFSMMAHRAEPLAPRKGPVCA